MRAGEKEEGPFSPVGGHTLAVHVQAQINRDTETCVRTYGVVGQSRPHVMAHVVYCCRLSSLDQLQGLPTPLTRGVRSFEGTHRVFAHHGREYEKQPHSLVHGAELRSDL